MSTFLTWFFKDARVTELLMCIPLSLNHITGPIYHILILCFPLSGSIFLGIIKMSEFLRL